MPSCPDTHKGIVSFRVSHDASLSRSISASSITWRNRPTHSISGSWSYSYMPGNVYGRYRRSSSPTAALTLASSTVSTSFVGENSRAPPMITSGASASSATGRGNQYSFAESNDARESPRAGTAVRVAMICPRTGTIPEGPRSAGSSAGVYAFDACRTCVQAVLPRAVWSAHRPSSSASSAVTGVRVCKRRSSAALALARRKSSVTSLSGQTLWPGPSAPGRLAPYSCARGQRSAPVYEWRRRTSHTWSDVSHSTSETSIPNIFAAS